MQERKLTKIYIETTTQCENNCRHCYFSEYKGSPQLGFDEIIEMQEFFKSIGVLSLTYAGADPILRDDHKEIILNGKKLGLSQTFCTRGVLNKIPQLKEICETYPEHIQFSVDPTLSNKSFDYEKNRVLEIGDCVSKYENIYVSWVITLTNDFLEYADDLLDTVYKSGANELRIHKLVPNKLSEINSFLFPDNQRYIEILSNFISNFSARFPFGGIEVEECVSVSKAILSQYSGQLEIVTTGCPIGHSALTIDHRGQVFLCPLNKDSKMKLGDDWRYIINYWKAFNDDAPFDRYKFKGLSCSQCSDFEVCLGGCRCQAVVNSDNFWGKDPNCIKR